MAKRKKTKKKGSVRHKKRESRGSFKIPKLKLTLKRNTNLKFILDELDLSQTGLSVLAGVEKYQVSNIASGTKTDCYLSTALRICKALSVMSKREITLDHIFGDKSRAYPVPPVAKKIGNDRMLLPLLKRYFSNDSRTYNRRVSLRNKIIHQLVKY
jgi:DNA-binding Xre family transcriptional regulator